MFSMIKTVVMCFFMATLVILFANVFHAKINPENFVFMDHSSSLAMPMGDIVKNDLKKS